MTGPGHCGRVFSSLCCPAWSQPQEYEALWPAPGVPLEPAGVRAALRGPQGHGPGPSGQSTALRAAWPGAGEGRPFPHQSLLHSYPRFSGSRGKKTSMESRSFISFSRFSFSSFRARRWRPLRGDPLAEGDGRVEGSGKHHWPSESGIETDGRGEQYYHSKDPMGAIQQIPY